MELQKGVGSGGIHVVRLMDSKEQREILSSRSGWPRRRVAGRSAFLDFSFRCWPLVSLVVGPQKPSKPHVDPLALAVH